MEVASSSSKEITILYSSVPEHLREKLVKFLKDKSYKISDHKEWQYNESWVDGYVVSWA